MPTRGKKRKITEVDFSDTGTVTSNILNDSADRVVLGANIYGHRKVSENERKNTEETMESVGGRANQSEARSSNSKVLTSDDPMSISTGTKITSRRTEVATPATETPLATATKSASVSLDHVLEAARATMAITRLSATAGRFCANLQAEVGQVLAGNAPPHILQNIHQQVKWVMTALAGKEPSFDEREEILSSETLQLDVSDDELNDGSEMCLESSSESISSNESSSDSDEADEESTSGESEKSDDENEKPDPKIVELDKATPNEKPNIRPLKPQDHVRVALLRERIKDFIPKMEKSEAEMEKKRQAGTLKTLNAEDVDGDERVIEMDLGLGVLEEKQPPTSAIDGIALKENQEPELSWLEFLEKRFPTKPHPGIQEVMEHLEKNEMESSEGSVEQRSKNKKKLEEWKRKCERLYQTSGEVLAREPVSHLSLALVKGTSPG